MEPLFSRPVLASYFASKSRRDEAPGRADDHEHAHVASERSRRSVIASTRLAFGALLIAAGERLAGTPPVMAGDSTGTTA